MLHESIQQTIDWLKSNPDNRIGGSYALDRFDHRTDHWLPEAVCFCTLGYLMKEACVQTDTELLNLIESANSSDLSDIIDANDENDLETVIQILEGWLQK